MLNNNKTLDKNIAKTFFVQEKLPQTINVNFYLDPGLKNNISIKKVKDNKASKNGKLIFHKNCLISVQHLYIHFDIITEIIAVAHENKYSSFSKYYKIVARL